MQKRNRITIFVTLGTIAAIVVLIFFVLKSGQDQNSSTASLSIFEKAAKLESIRKPAVSGAFYSSSASELKNQINKFLEQTESPEINNHIKALMVPHAGYVYSGQIAAHAYKLLTNLEIKKVILIGPSHYSSIKGAVIDKNDKWQTPLGEVEIDIELRNALAKESSLFKIGSVPHKKEHSLEVQIPFLQTVLKDFKILPILINELSDKELETISQILAEHIDEYTIIIASSDMSHYPSAKDAEYVDSDVIAGILTGDIKRLEKTVEIIETENISNLETTLCGKAAVEVVMKIMEVVGVSSINLLDYANSNSDRAVGYASVVFSSDRVGGELNEYEQKELLEIAKQAVESYIKTGEIPEFEIESFFLNKKQGAFVTLKKQGRLRGCIGAFQPEISLYQVVSEMAISAASKDTRFYPVEESELEDLEYEVSVLSFLQKIDDWHEIEAGKHGVQIKQGLKSGVFLPQVATENNWDREEFLENLCAHKAGLPEDCYKDKATEIKIFTAQVFGE